MKSFILVSLFIVCQTLACSEQEKNICNDYCDIKVVAAEQDAINKLCKVSDSNLEFFGDKCDRTCGEILEYVVDPEERKDSSECLSCIVENTFEPSESHIAEAKEICFERCNNLGGYQFFFTFFISPPNWDC